jgi:radical SAM superfamily enzyme YgiQ (UPF0313 family)
MLYPSPYKVGMSSLGFQTLYRHLNEIGIGAHRAFLPDDWEPSTLPWPAPKRQILAYESLEPISRYPIIGLSVAYELEVVGIIRVLEGSGIPLLAKDRGERDPIIVAGGPLTNSNPACILPFVDVLICGEAEGILPDAIARIENARTRSQKLAQVSTLQATTLGQVAPGHAIEVPTLLARAPQELLPAYSAIVTPNTELSNMFLVEPERGCSRRCTFCVMRGETTGGMRPLSLETPLSKIPDYAKKVGLVGAAVTDLPHLEELVARIVESGRGLGISSLRADRLTPQLLANLARGGYRSITVASDGISERIRQSLHRKISADDLLRAAELCKNAGFRHLKIYQMMGVPGETEEDVVELGKLARELAKHIRLTMTFSTFVAKRNTPMDRLPFFGIPESQARLASIRKALAGSAEIRPQPPKWAAIEYELAQRGIEVGYAAIEAVHAGGSFAAWQQALKALGPNERAPLYGDEARRAQREGRAAGLPRLPLLQRS